jgi:hypothetical protein
MGTNELPPRQDAVDEAVHELLEYLTLAQFVEGELNTIAPAIRRVILALLVAEDSAGHLTPYREHLLGRMRASNPRAGSAVDPA